MNQFEHDQLATMAGGWEIRAMATVDESERRILKSNARELRYFLSSADTAPGGPPDGEPERLPTMRAPRVPSFPESEQT